MPIEYEATFKNIDKKELRIKLKKIGAKLKKPEFLQKRVTFNLPGKKNRNETWIRVRDERDRIIMTWKSISDENIIESQKEINLEIDDFERGVQMLKAIGCIEKSYQETKRELWLLDGVEITLDTWPFLEPIIEIEGKNELSVKQISKKLGFDWKNALFCGITPLYVEKYKITEDIVNNQTPKIIFDMENPFLK